MELTEIAKLFLEKSSQNLEQINSIESAPWMDEIEEKLGRKYPKSFHAIYSCYTFPSFELGELEFFSNLGPEDYESIQNSILRDKIIFNVTKDNGYIYFARASGGSYDPICFNTHRKKNGDFEIVKLNHESILQYEKIEPIKVIAKSFKQFMEDNVGS